MNTHKTLSLLGAIFTTAAIIGKDYLEYLPLHSIIRHECSKDRFNTDCDIMKTFLKDQAEYKSLKKRDDGVDTYLKKMASNSNKWNPYSTEEIKKHLLEKRMLKIKLRDKQQQAHKSFNSLMQQAMISEQSREQRTKEEIELFNNGIENIVNNEPQGKLDYAN